MYTRPAYDFTVIGHDAPESSGWVLVQGSGVFLCLANLMDRSLEGYITSE
jgi:hypothetical protein